MRFKYVYKIFKKNNNIYRGLVLFLLMFKLLNNSVLAGSISDGLLKIVVDSVKTATSQGSAKENEKAVQNNPGTNSTSKPSADNIQKNNSKFKDIKFIPIKEKHSTSIGNIEIHVPTNYDLLNDGVVLEIAIEAIRLHGFYESRITPQVRILTNGAKLQFIRNNKSVVMLAPKQGETTAEAAVNNAMESSRQRANSIYAQYYYDTQYYKNNLMIEETNKKLTVINNQKKMESRKLYDNITSKFNVVYMATSFAKFQELETNPFVYENKYITIKGTFLSMISASEATFDMGSSKYLVSGVPRTRFTSKGKSSLLVAKVIGYKSIKEGPFELNLLNVEYADAYECKESNCDEVLRW